MGWWEGKQALAGQRPCGVSVGWWGLNKPWRAKGSVWALRAAGGLWHVFTTISLLCIAGAFPKFAIFENRFFFKTRRSQSEIYFNRFPFFSRFWYITLNDKVLCGLMRGKQALTGQRPCGSSVGWWGLNKPWRGKRSVWALWVAGGLLEGSDISLRWYFGCVLRARFLNLQFLKTAFVF